MTPHVPKHIKTAKGRHTVSCSCGWMSDKAFQDAEQAFSVWEAHEDIASLDETVTPSL